MAEENKLHRRNFLSAATVAIGGLIGIGLGIPSLIYVIGPATQKTASENWIRIGSTSKIEIGTPTLFKVKIQHQTGWIVDEEEVSVYVITQNGRDFVALSNVCTHLGCRVRWISDKDIFFCPCHNGVFDIEGKVVDGPPPRPLDQYETKVEDDSLYILV
jgi:menaquinol-cytochrome c reductase iron-sulfur subunit